MYKRYLTAGLALALVTGFFSCTKDFLDVKPNKALVVPVTLTDFQALLDNASNTTGSGVFNSSPGLNSIADGDYTTTSTALEVLEKNSYLWAPDIYEGAATADWNDPYQQAFYCNVVLDGLQKIKPAFNEQGTFNQVKGTALFYRAFAFYNLAQQFCMPYSSASSGDEMGIPILLSSDVNQKYNRGSLEQSYRQMISDLLEAATLLPAQSALKTRPDQLAAKAMLARIYLAMGKYTEAESYANAVLTVYDELIDYNNLTINATSATNPFPKSIPVNSNVEVLFYSAMINYGFSTSTLTNVATDLYASYNPNDLRKSVYFVSRGPGVFNFKGNYTGSTKWFSGLATDELYLTRAECLARKNQVTAAMADLNALLIKRFLKNNFNPLTAADQDEALALILMERRKELVSRGLRWGDLKRLNQDSRFTQKLTRIFAGQTYTLSADDKRYAFPIPDNEVLLGGIPQNKR